MLNSSNSPEPKLSAPGAGLPRPELWAARAIFALHRWRNDRADAESLIGAERDQLLSLTKGLPCESAARRVLIPRLSGLEDSSRYWSIFMTLEHVRIVNEVVTKTIALLAEGKSPEKVASTADVKPSPEVSASVVDAFPEGCERLIRLVATVPDLQTKKRYAHPWFGPLDAAAWHHMAGFHMRLHRRQILSIRERL